MKFVGDSTPAWTFSNSPKHIPEDLAKNPFLTSPNVLLKKVGKETPGPAMYDTSTPGKVGQNKGISMASAPRKVDKVWILNKDIPGP